MENWNKRGSARALYRLPEFLKIVLLSTFIAVAVGIFHNAIAITMSFEFYKYLTKNKLPDYFFSNLLLDGMSRRYILATIWGIYGSWWIGAIFGLIVGVVSRAFGSFQLSCSDLTVPMALEAMKVLVSSYISGFLYSISLKSNTAEHARSILSSKFYLHHDDLKSWTEDSCFNFLIINRVNGAMYDFSILFSAVLIIWAIFRRFYLAHHFKKATDDKLKVHKYPSMSSRSSVQNFP